MSNDTGKWLPLNMDGSFHSCNQAQQQTGTKKVETKAKAKKQEPIVAVNQQRIGPLSMEELDDRLKKVEKFLFMAGKK